jgi:tetratricopeptide (TPR) repeat protein
MKTGIWFLPFWAFFLCCFPALSQGKDEKLEAAIKKLELQKNPDSNRVLALNELAREYRRTDVGQAFKNAREALKLAREISFSRGEAMALTTLGVMLKDQGNPDSALVYHFDALKICEENPGLKKLRARVLNNIGVSYKDKLDFASAVKYYSSAIKINEELKDNEGLGMCYNNIGIIYKRQGENEKALENFKKAGEFHLKNNDPLSRSKVLNNMASIYLRLDQFKEAFEVLAEGEQLMKKNKDNGSLAILYGHYTIAMRKTGNLEKAEEYCILSGKIFKELNDLDGLAANYFDLAEIQILKKKYNDALYFAEQGLDISKKIGKVETLMEGHLVLSQAYEGLSDYKKALDHHKKMMLFKDSIRKTEDVETARLFQARFESDRREWELGRLKEQEEVIKKTRARNRIIIYSLSGLCVLLAGSLVVLLKKRKKTTGQ